MRKIGYGLLVWLVSEVVLMSLVGKLLGGWGLLAMLLGGLVVGRQLLRGQSLTSIRALQQAEPPGVGVLRVLAGMLFILPGFLSDLLALLCLYPGTGRWLQSRLVAGFAAHQAGGFGASGGTLYEGEVEREDTKVPLPRP